jgi:hypothetical protein
MPKRCSTKRCKRCDQERPRSEFVTRDGKPSSSSTYCIHCFEATEFQDYIETLLTEVGDSQPDLSDTHPPTKAQLNLMQQLGVKPGADWSSSKVAFWIRKAVRHPKYSEKLMQICFSTCPYLIKHNGEFCDLRDFHFDDYGVEFAKKYLRWDSISDDTDRHILIWKHGKNIVCDIVEFDGVDVDDKNHCSC